MRNKKGDLMNNVLGVIIAVIGLSLLAYGAYKVYQNVVNSEDQKAKNLADLIEGKVEALKEGQIGKFNLVKLEGWGIAGWSLNDPKRPDKCSLNSCICICNDVVDISFGDSLINSCQENGFCRKFGSKNIKVYKIFKSFEYSSDTFSKNLADYLSNPEIVDFNVITLSEKEALSEITIYKNDTDVIILYLNPEPFKAPPAPVLP